MEPTTDEFTLYHYFASSASWRVRWALALKGVPFRAVHVDLVRDEHLAPENLARNPIGHVPTLAHRGRTLTESVAICEYLDEVVAGGARLRPDEPWARARMRQIVETINAGTQPLVNLAVRRRLGDEAAKPWSAWAIARGLGACEALVRSARAEGFTGPFALGAAPTLADLCVVPQLFGARRFHVDLTPYPALLGIEAAALATDAGASAAPDRWKPALPRGRAASYVRVFWSCRPPGATKPACARGHVRRKKRLCTAGRRPPRTAGRRPPCAVHAGRPPRRAVRSTASRPGPLQSFIS
jgi:maleylacetoacetate isomerase